MLGFQLQYFLHVRYFLYLHWHLWLFHFWFELHVLLLNLCLHIKYFNIYDSCFPWNTYFCRYVINSFTPSITFIQTNYDLRGFKSTWVSLTTHVSSFSILSLFLSAYCETSLTTLFVAKFTHFDFVSNIEPANLLNLWIVIYLVW